MLRVARHTRASTAHYLDMGKEFDKAREGDAAPTADAHDGPAPGSTSQSSKLSAPKEPVQSGLLAKADAKADEKTDVPGKAPDAPAAHAPASSAPPVETKAKGAPAGTGETDHASASAHGGPSADASKTPPKAAAPATFSTRAPDGLVDHYMDTHWNDAAFQAAVKEMGHMPAAMGTELDHQQDRESAEHGQPDGWRADDTVGIDQARVPGHPVWSRDPG